MIYLDLQRVNRVGQHNFKMESILIAKIGYARVSSTDQNLDRQLELLSNCDKFFQTKLAEKTPIEKYFKK